MSLGLCSVSGGVSLGSCCMLFTGLLLIEHFVRSPNCVDLTLILVSQCCVHTFDSLLSVVCICTVHHGLLSSWRANPLHPRKEGLVHSHNGFAWSGWSELKCSSLLMPVNLILCFRQCNALVRMRMLRMLTVYAHLHSDWCNW